MGPCRTTTGDNFTEDAHPIHIHEITFDVVDRQNLETGAVRGPEPWETGRKDTVIPYPGESTRVKATYDRPGPFVWHCQIIEHEDHEMMRPLPRGGRVVGGRAERVVTQRVAALPIPILPWAWAPRAGDDDFGDVAGPDLS